MFMDSFACPPGAAELLGGRAEGGGWAEADPSLAADWARALQLFPSVASAARGTSAAAEASAAGGLAATGAPSAARKAVSTDNFFAVRAELERLSDEMAARRRAQDTETLPSAPDEMDPRMHKGLDGPAAAACRQAAERFAAGDYRAACEVLVGVVNTCPPSRLSAALLNSLAACHFRLEQWQASLRHTTRALEMEPGLMAAARRVARVYLATGDAEAARRVVAIHKGRGEWAPEAAALHHYENYASLLELHQFPHALRELDAALAVFPCGALEALRVQLLSLDGPLAALQHAREALRRYPFSVDLRHAKASLDFQTATSVAQLEALLAELNAGDAMALTDTRFRTTAATVHRCIAAVRNLEGLRAAGNWAALADACSAGLRDAYTGEGVVFILLSSRAEAHAELGRWYDGLDDAHRAMTHAETGPQRAQLLLVLARCEEGLRRLREALAHAQQSVALDGTDAARRYLAHLLQRQAAADEARRQQEEQERQQQKQQQQRQQQQQQQNQQKQQQQERERERQRQQSRAGEAGSGSNGDSPSADAFAVLGLPTSTRDAAVVKKTYRLLAMKWHPDKWSGASAADLKTAEETFKRVQAAYEGVMGIISS